GSTQPRTASTAAPPAAERLAGIWDAPARAGVAARFAAVDRPEVAGTWRRVSSDADAYAARWATLWNDTCRADPGKDPLLHAQRTTCLDNALIEFGGVAASLRTAEVTSFADGMASQYFAASTLPLDDCTRVEVLREQRQAPPPERRDDVRRLREQFELARADARLGLNANRPDVLEPAFQHMQEVVDTLTTLGESGAREAALRAHYVASAAVRLRGADRHDDPIGGAKAAIADAVRRAEAAHEDRIAAFAYWSRAELELAISGPTDDIAVALDRAEAAWARAGRPEIRRPGTTPRMMRAALHIRLARYDDAIQLLREDIAADSTGTLLNTFESRTNLARLLSLRGEHAQAIEVDQDRLVAARRALGDVHRQVAHAHRELSRTFARADQFADALREVEAELAVFDRLDAPGKSRGDAHERAWIYALRLGRTADAARHREALLRAGVPQRRLAHASLNVGVGEPWFRAELEDAIAAEPGLDPHALDEALALVAFMTGDASALRTHAERITRRAPEHAPDRWVAHVNQTAWWLALAHAWSGRTREAERALARLAPVRASPDFMLALNAWMSDGHVQAALRRWPEARASIEQAFTRIEPFLSDDNHDVGDVLAWLGRARLEAGDARAAILPLEQSLRISMVCCESRAYYTPMAQLALARALWDTGGDKVRARWLAAQARDGYRRLGYRGADREDATRWLAAHPAP
ncbi:MAG: tetratricopeptide repeat protein, partial [Deltaproteobacteria bacterium]|nr:tetratricopeptide repeat protein [Kofleriaceae bacterium]